MTFMHLMNTVFGGYWNWSVSAAGPWNWLATGLFLVTLLTALLAAGTVIDQDLPDKGTVNAYVGTSVLLLLLGPLLVILVFVLTPIWLTIGVGAWSFRRKGRRLTEAAARAARDRQARELEAEQARINQEISTLVQVEKAWQEKYGFTRKAKV